MVRLYRERFHRALWAWAGRSGDRRARRPGVHPPELPGRDPGVPAYFDNAPVYGHEPSLEDFAAQAPLTVAARRR